MDNIRYCANCNETGANVETVIMEEKEEVFSKGYLSIWDNPDEEICPICKIGKPIKTGISSRDFNIIAEVSDFDRDFLEAMVKLKKENIIEYQSRMIEFRNLVQKPKIATNQTKRKPTIPEQCRPHCPTCNSTNIEKISFGKKAVGGVMFGLLSSDVRRTMHCLNCGYKW